MRITKKVLRFLGIVLMRKDRCVALIPARSGSKRILNKNIKEFNGVPMISYPIKAAIDSKLFDNIFVSTDSTKIQSIAEEYGAETLPLRPLNISGDESTTLEVVQYEVNQMLNVGMNFDYLACIYPATPLIDQSLLSEAFRKIKSQDCDFCFPVVKNHVGYERLFEITASGQLQTRPSFEGNQSTQVGPSVYRDAGQFYWGRTSTWLRAKSILSDNSLAIPIPEFLGIDIDTMENWEHAELVFSGMKMKNKKVLNQNDFE